MVTLGKEDRGKTLMAAGPEALNVCSSLQFIQVDEAQVKKTNHRDMQICCSLHKNETHQQCRERKNKNKKNTEVLICEELM